MAFFIPMEKKCFKLLQILLWILIFINATTAVCNVCQKNQAACINTTSFHLCFGEKTPTTSVIYHCKEGFYCTSQNAICIHGTNNISPSCGDVSECDLCSPKNNYVFACLSRNTFQMCYGALRPTGQIGYCPSGYVCDASNPSVCVSVNTPHTITCDIPSTPTTTTKPPVTPTLPTPAPPGTPLTPNAVCAQVRDVGLFPPIPNDPYCKRYIYCWQSNGIFQGEENSCSSGSYYEIEMEMCSLRKPSYCL